MFDAIKKFFQPLRRRLELRLVPYGAEADKLIAAGWQIAKEEDANRTPFHVYLELLAPTREGEGR